MISFGVSLFYSLRLYSSITRRLYFNLEYNQRRECYQLIQLTFKPMAITSVDIKKYIISELWKDYVECKWWIQYWDIKFTQLYSAWIIVKNQLWNDLLAFRADKIKSINLKMILAEAISINSNQ